MLDVVSFPILVNTLTVMRQPKSVVLNTLSMALDDSARMDLYEVFFLKMKRYDWIRKECCELKSPFKNTHDSPHPDPLAHS